MIEPGYPAARLVAAIIQPHFTPQPDSQDIEDIVNAAFWASLRRNEGYLPTISVAFLPVEQAERPLRFEHSFPLAAEALAELAPAVERPGIHLGVWPEADGLRVWGTTRKIPIYCFVLEVVAPGLLVIKRRQREESSKFVNIVVLEGDQVKVIAQNSELLDAPDLISSLLGFDSPSDSLNVFVELAASMRAHRRGGSLLVVPTASEEWRESIIHPVKYVVEPSFSELAELVKAKPRTSSSPVWEEALRRSVEAVAGLTAVDGATVITDRCELLAFGAKIGRRQKSPRIEQVVVTEPIQGISSAVVNTAQIGGTRHLSAAQFAQDQRDSFALVASQDGRFTVFRWSDGENMVHAHRLETLLL